MKKLVGLCLFALMSISAKANNELPSYATTEPAKHGEYLKSLEYSFSKLESTTKDDVLICLADVIENNDKQIIKLDTQKVIVAIGSIRGKGNFIGVVPVIRYNLKVSLNDNNIGMSLYNIKQAMDDEFGNKPETSYSKIGTWKNSGIYKILPVIEKIPNEVNACLNQ
ncbi:hypothetical protein [Psychrobacter urativorans]|uniref:hypothetical protein n=1 Tax=Psychrobacter urativorans TaxID=45610 RepID=UPI001917FD97|nr:hypothetical protein [Psychrobacter urativorans]